MFSYKSFFPFPPSLPYASHRLYVEDAQCDVPQDHFSLSFSSMYAGPDRTNTATWGGKKEKKKEKKKLIG